MAMPFKTWEKMEPGRKAQILTEAEAFLDGLSPEPAKPLAKAGQMALDL